MLEDPQADAPTGTTTTDTPADTPAAAPPAKKAAAKRTAAKKSAAKKTTTKKAAAKPAADAPAEPPSEGSDAAPAKKAAAKKSTAKKSTAKKTTKKAAAKPADEPAATPTESAAEATAAAADTMLLFKAPEPTAAPPRRTRKAAAPKPDPAEDDQSEGPQDAAADKPAAKKTSGKGGSGKGQGRGKGSSQAKAAAEESDRDDDKTKDDRAGQSGPADDRAGQDGEEGEGGARRRRRRGGRRRRKPGDGESDGTSGDEQDESSDEADDQQDDSGGEGTSRRRRRRRRTGEDGDDGGDDPSNTVTRVRKSRTGEDQITSISGSTRLEAKKQRRRDGREAGRRRAPIVSEAEFLARREAVDRVMVIRQRDELTQIAVLEDKVLVEHYVARESQTSLIGNVYLGRVQNVLPSMEAAFIDIGKGRNAVLYAGEVNWTSLGHKDGQPRKIESFLSSGQSVLVQVTKDPIGHKGARLTSQISLAGRFLVYVPDGTTSGISRKLPDTERNRLKTLLKEIVPDTAGVIVRTAAEGASEDELTRDVERLKARWEDIEKKAKGSSPQLLYGEPDLTLKVVRDLFTEDFSKLVIEGDDAWDTVQGYVTHVAPDLEERLERFDRGDNGKDVFGAYRIDEQIAKGLDRKVWLPSGGSLIIDRTEAMTVVDVNTGKFTGSGGNLEETVTKNNLEAAEEIIRQLRLRDIGGIIVVDFIDMVLESNRDLVLRRMVECLGRDRTRHQVAEVTSLGLVQMTRKRIGTGLLEAFSENCDHCQGRGVIVHDAPVEPKKAEDDTRRGGTSGRRSRGGRGRDGSGSNAGNGGGNGNGKSGPPSPKDVAAMARPADEAKDEPKDEASESQPEPTPVEPVETPVAAEPEPTPVEDQPEPTQAESEPEPTQAESQPEPTRVEPVETPDEAHPDETPSVPEKPKVVTRTRRRSASRPAGPPTSGTDSVPTLASEPTSTGSVGQPPASGTVEPGTASTEPGGADGGGGHPVVEHVPIKKKGSRKR